MSTPSLPKTTKQWQVTGKAGIEQSLQFSENVSIMNPQVEEEGELRLGDHDVLVKFHYASLNYRDLIIPMGKYPFATKVPVVPGKFC